VFNQKGQIRIIEAFLSVAVIFSVVLVSVTFPFSPNLARQRSLTVIGTQALMELDNNGTLGSLIAQENWTLIKESLGILLPVGVAFNLTVYDESELPVNSVIIQNSDLLGGGSVSVRYVCATQSQVVRFFVLRLQLAWAG